VSLVVLIHGEPGNGKSYLAERLRTDHAFAVLELDEEYVDFIRGECPGVYFELLGYYIGPHYYHILKAQWVSKEFFGRDFVDEWHTHLQARVQELSALHDRLAVEGGLLFDCMDRLEAALKPSASVVRIEVKRRSYFWQGSPITADQIAEIAPPAH
jgi:hypothetical protein